METMTRKWLAAQGLTDEQVEAVIGRHTSVLAEIKDERDNLREKAGRADKAEADLKTANERIAELEKTDGTKLQGDLDKANARIKELEGAEENGRKRTAVLAVLKEAGITRESFLRLVAKEFDHKGYTLDKDGKLSKEDADTIKDRVSKDYADYVSRSRQQGTDRTDPPGGAGNKQWFDNLSLAEKMKFANEHPAEYAAMK